MTLSKLKKYVGKAVRVHFRYTKHTADGILIYRENAIPSCKYSLFQPQNSYHMSTYYVALEPKYIGHIEESSEMALLARTWKGVMY